MKKEWNITLIITSQKKLNLKNYFIANGEMVFINMSFEEIESRVQESLDECTSGMVQFRVKEIGEKEVRMFFIRNFLVTLIIVYDEKIGF